MGATRDAQSCGSYRGYMRHYRRDGKVDCFACTVAMNLYHQDRRLAAQRRATLDTEVAIWERLRRRPPRKPGPPPIDPGGPDVPFSAPLEWLREWGDTP